ncbi:MAG: hypothetical protein WBZ36_20700, partial [Candidatus Nitrosopolaris sp.]
MSITPQTTSNYIKNFPFPTLRDKQSYVLKEIDAAFTSGYKYIVLEAPTGFGKSPVAIATASTLGSSYICTSTKDLQTQYARDFPFIQVAKGKNNFTCEVKDDFIRNGTYKCKACGLGPLDHAFRGRGRTTCFHTSVEYGPCMSDDEFDCKYKTMLKDYATINKRTKQERIVLAEGRYRSAYSEWLYLDNFREDIIRDWRPCQYYHQLNTALAASNSVLNYAMFLAIMNKNLPSRELLVLDEAHLLETEVVKFIGISISRKKWRKYILDLKINNHGEKYDVIRWLDFIEDLKENLLDVKTKIPSDNKELLVDAQQDIEKLDTTIESISSNTSNWIVSEIKMEGDNDIINVELKPLDVSPYCKDVFTKCGKTLMMSATILDVKTFCKSIGLSYNDVKVIRVGSDFSLKRRPIQVRNVAYLNYNELQKNEVKSAIASGIDRIMTFHKQ